VIDSPTDGTLISMHTLAMRPCTGYRCSLARSCQRSAISFQANPLTHPTGWGWRPPDAAPAARPPFGVLGPHVLDAAPFLAPPPPPAPSAPVCEPTAIPPPGWRWRRDLHIRVDGPAPAAEVP